MSTPSHNPSTELKPLLVSVRKAREILGGISHNRFWQLARLGELELVGTERKRWVVYESIERYVTRLPRRQITECRKDFDKDDLDAAAAAPAR
jgi:hypothetical protein